MAHAVCVTCQISPVYRWPGGPAVAALLGASLLGGGVAAAEAAEADAAAEVEGEEPPGGPSWSEAVQQLRRLTFFTYERRLREHSTTEKIFDYFSSIKEGSSKFMTETDLMRSVVPVFPVGEEVRSGALDGERACSGVSPLVGPPRGRTITTQTFRTTLPSPDCDTPSSLSRPSAPCSFSLTGETLVAASTGCTPSLDS